MPCCKPGTRRCGNSALEFGCVVPEPSAADKVNLELVSTRMKTSGEFEKLDLILVRENVPNVNDPRYFLARTHRVNEKSCVKGIRHPPYAMCKGRDLRFRIRGVAADTARSTNCHALEHGGNAVKRETPGADLTSDRTHISVYRNGRRVARVGGGECVISLGSLSMHHMGTDCTQAFAYADDYRDVERF